MAFQTYRRSSLWFVFICCLVLFFTGQHVSASVETEKRSFNVSEGYAIETLKEAAQQAGAEFIFSADLVQGVRTISLRGEYIPLEAFNLLLAETSLAVFQHEKSGIYAITKVSDIPNPEREQTPIRETEMNTKKRNLLNAIAAVLTLGIVGTDTWTYGQDTDEEEIFELSPFEVNAADDKGYVATNTLAGSRLNTLLRDTPASISVMTSKFLSDIGADDIQQAIVYGLNAGNDIGGGGIDAGAVTGNGLIENEFNFQIRGYRSAAATRNYFSTTLASDVFNIDRIEIARGPNSLIFGVGGPGGIVNTAIKNAYLDNEFTDIGLKFGSYNLQRFTVDTNQTIIEGKLAVRLNLLHQEKDGWKDFAKNDQDRQALALTFQASENTKIRVNGEFGSLSQNRVRPWAPVDEYSEWVAHGSHLWDFGTSSAPWEADDDNYTQRRDNVVEAGWWTGEANERWNGLSDFIPEGRTAERRSGNLGEYPYLTDGPMAGKYFDNGFWTEGSSYYRVSEETISVFDTNSFVTDESIAPRTANPVGPGAVVLTDYTDLGISIDHRIGENLNLNFTINKSDIDHRNNTPMGFNNIAIRYDAMSMLPTFNNDGSYNATPGTRGARGEPGDGIGTLHFDSLVVNPYAGAMIMQYTPSYSLSNTGQDDIRLSGSYHLSTERLGNHNFLAFAQRSTRSRESEGFTMANVSSNRRDPTAAWNQTNTGRGMLATHVDLFSGNLAERGIPDPYTATYSDSWFWGNEAAASSRWEAGFVRTNLGRSEFEVDSSAFAIQSSFLEGSLVTTAGVRRDEVSIRNWGRIRDDLGEATGLSDPTGAQTEEGDSYSVGFVYQVPKLDWLRVFANKSTNFQTQAGAQRIEDEVNRLNLEIGALKGSGVDYGLKFDLFQHRVYATLGFYEVDQSNAVGGGFSSNVNNYINAIWTAIQNGGPDPDLPTDAANPSGHHFGGSETKSQVSEGWEFEVVANPTDNWRISFNASNTENEVSDLGTNVTAYIDKHRATWISNGNLLYNVNESPGVFIDSNGVYPNNSVGALVTGLDGLIDFLKAGEGLTETNVRPKNANLYTGYTLTEGRFKGLTIGGGMNYRGSAVLGVLPGTVESPETQVFMGGSYTTYSGMLGYEFQWDDVDVAIQLNIDNLGRNDDLQVLSSRWNPTAEALDTFYYYLDPRSVSVRANFKF